MARRKDTQPLSVDDVIDYTSGGVKPRAPHEAVQAGRHPRHDYAEYQRRQAVDQRSGTDWSDLEATAERYRTIDIRSMTPIRSFVRDPLGRSTRRRSDT